MSEDSATKIAIYSQDKLRELGYLPIAHPDGYIYFEKTEDDQSKKIPLPNCSEGPSISTEKCVLVGPVIKEVSSTPTTITQCQSIYKTEVSEICEVEYPAKQLNNILNNTIKTEPNEDVSKIENLSFDSVKSQNFDNGPELRLETNNENLQFKWKMEIEETGYASCFFQTCNFISLSLATMARHFTKCNGEPLFHSNLCSRCGCWLVSSMQRDIHAGNCFKNKFGTGIQLQAPPSPVVCKPGSAGKINVKPKVVKRKTTDGLTSGAIYFPCSTCGEHKSSIKQAKLCTHNKITSTLPETIVQPAPTVPAGSYLRRRAYTPVHIECWTLKLKTSNYIPCHFQDCAFIAMSVQDMCMHYGFCTGDSSFAQYRCGHCSGVVTSQKVLDIHIERSHLNEEHNAELSTSTSMSYENAVVKISNCANPTNAQLEPIKTVVKSPSATCSSSPKSERIVAAQNALIEGYHTPSILRKPSFRKVQRPKVEISSTNTNYGVHVGREEEFPSSAEEDDGLLAFTENNAEISLNNATQFQPCLRNDEVEGTSSHDILDVHGDHLHYTLVHRNNHLNYDQGTVFTKKPTNDITRKHVDLKKSETGNYLETKKLQYANITELKDNFAETLPLFVNQSSGTVAVVSKCKEQLESPLSVKISQVVVENALAVKPSIPNTLITSLRLSSTVLTMGENNEEGSACVNIAFENGGTGHQDFPKISSTTNKFRTDSLNCQQFEDVPLKAAVKRRFSESEGKISNAAIANSKTKYLRPGNNEKIIQSEHLTVEKVSPSLKDIDKVRDTSNGNERGETTVLSAVINVKETHARKTVITDARVLQHCSNLNDKHDVKIGEVKNVTIDTAVCEVVPTKRPRGRPRKNLIRDNAKVSVEVCKLLSQETSQILNEGGCKPTIKSDECEEIVPVVKRKRGRPPGSVKVSKYKEELAPKVAKGRMRIIDSDDEDSDGESIKQSSEENRIKDTRDIEDCETVYTPIKPSPKRGRPCKNGPPLPLKGNKKCAKCGEVVTLRRWERHNALKHAGLGWLVGESPVVLDVTHSNDILIRIRTAFKICTIATCEICGVSKKSFLGFHSHILICGRTEEEQQKAMIQCGHCGKKFMPYCLASHEKSHAPKLTPTQTLPDTTEVFGKRQSALRAISNLQETIAVERKSCVLIKKGDIPTSVAELIKKNWQCDSPHIKCTRDGCDMTSSSASRATNHFLTCPTMPEEYYQCLECPFYSVTEQVADAHTCSQDRKREKKRSDDMNDYDVSTESDDSGNDEYEVNERSRKSHKKDNDGLTKEETIHKKACRKREKLIMKGPCYLYPKAFEVELAWQKQMTEQEEQFEEFNTVPFDWKIVEEPILKKYLPPLTKSLPVRHRINGITSEFESCQVFQAFKNSAFKAGFVGGTVQNLAWCPVNLKRAAGAQQYLAITVANQTDNYPSVYSSKMNSSLLQIWDFGVLDYKCTEYLKEPRMAVSLALDYGDVWDLTWSPKDAWHDNGNGLLPRIGLVAAAFHDGCVRIFSISFPNVSDELQAVLPIYKVHPVVVLTRERRSEDVGDPCLRVTWGSGGIVCSGHRSGMVSVYRLSQLHSCHFPKQNKTFVLHPLRSFEAHTTAITAITLCPTNTRLLATAGADRVFRYWDLRAAPIPLRSESGAAVQILQWMRNWPGLFYLFEENGVALNLPSNFSNNCFPQFKCQSHVKDFSFSDWMFVTCVGNVAGEVMIRPNPDPFHEYVGEKTRSTVVASKAEITEMEKSSSRCSNICSYEEGEAAGVGLTFTDNNVRDLVRAKSKDSASEPCRANYSLNAVEKVTFNQNFLTFNHLAIGYKCGIVRVLRLKYLQEDINLSVASQSEFDVITSTT